MIFIFVFFYQLQCIIFAFDKEKCIAVHLLANILQKNEIL